MKREKGRELREGDGEEDGNESEKKERFYTPKFKNETVTCTWFRPTEQSLQTMACSSIDFLPVPVVKKHTTLHRFFKLQ